jgi:AhpD family alkylhydroperoxidase
LAQKLKSIESAGNENVPFPKETKLSVKTLELIATGVSIAVNCQECLKTHAHNAHENGAEEDEIVEAIKVGKMVRSGASSIMDRFVAREATKVGCDKLGTDNSNGCGCG